MRASTLCALAFAGAVHALPTLLAERGSSNNCVGIGISACDPINVGGTQNSHNSEGKSGDGDDSSNNCVGIGISVCNPVNVNGTQDSHNEGDGNDATDPIASSQPTGSSSSGSNGDSLLNLSPDVSPDLDLSSNNGCFGLGISACNPINVDGVQNSHNSNDDDETPSSSYTTTPQDSASSSSGGDSLINISPTISPDLDLSSNNDCIGVGISACDPINVNGTQNSYNDNDDDDDDTAPQSSSSSSSGGDSLINISPDISPDVDLSSNNNCIGLGVSVCDPINVDGTQNSHNGDSTSDSHETAPQDSSGSSSGGDSLINISPDLSPDLDLSSNNDCIGLGISVCDPINVNGTQNSDNSNGESSSSPGSDSGGVDASSENDCFGLGISACDPINVKGTQNSGNDGGSSSPPEQPPSPSEQSPSPSGKKGCMKTPQPSPPPPSSSGGDSLINISPTVDPVLDLSSNNDCIGLGVSVCDPINVHGTQGSHNENGSPPREEKTTTTDKSTDGSLINISPVVDPTLDLSSNNDCFGLGISACDPINVGGTQNSGNHD